MDYETIKESGLQHYQNKSHRNIGAGGNSGTSRSTHYKSNKARGFRRKLDRYSHHRKRQTLNTAIRIGGENLGEFNLPKIVKGTQWFRGSSNSVAKQSVGYHENFYNTTSKQQNHTEWRDLPHNSKLVKYTTKHGIYMDC